MLYHFTSARLLEEIIASGRLMPSDDYGWNLLWATEAQTTDIVASRYHYEPVVARFTLDPADFEPWDDLRLRFKKKRRARAERMTRSVLKRGLLNPTKWYVRRDPLPKERWLRIDVRDQRWQPYASETWRRRGKPQLAKMPWVSEREYEGLGIDLGIDLRWMDPDSLNDYLADKRYREQQEEDETNCDEL